MSQFSQTSPNSNSCDFLKHCRENQRCVELGVNTLNDIEVIRFYQACHFDAIKATNELIDLLIWRRDIDFEKVLNDSYPDYTYSILSFYDVTPQGNPILIYKAKNLLPLQDDSEILIKQSIAVIGNVQRKYNNAKVYLLIDREGATKDNVNVAFAKQAVALFTKYFPETLQELMVFQSNFLMWSLWSIIKPFMDPDTVKKVSILSEEEYKKALVEKLGSDSVPVRLGGTNTKPEPKRPSDVQSKSPPVSPVSYLYST